MIKYRLILISAIFGFLLTACSNMRKKDPDELVLHEMILEKNGVYYWGDCEEHADTKYTGTDTCYHYENGKIKATYTIKNGLPDGHWEQFDSTGKKSMDLYFEEGLLIKKVSADKKLAL